MVNNKNQGKKKFYRWLIGILILVALAIGLSWPTDYFIEGPGESVPVGQFIKSETKKPMNLYLVTVSITSRPASVLEYLWSYTQKFATRTPSKDLLAGQTSSQYQELQNWYMETSQQTAIYYAAKKAGLKPKLNYHGVYVMNVQKNSSFRHRLQIGDTVLGANDRRFRSTQEMMSYLNQQKPGSKVTIEVLRNNEKKNFTGKIVKLAGSKRNGIGIQLVERTTVTTKPKLKIDVGEIGGPSAGLMFTLESYEIFSHRNLTKNHKVAGTGTINVLGQVGMIGGVDKKVVAADRAGAEVFFAPSDHTGIKKSESNYAVAKRTAKQIHSKMKIVPVKTFDDALNYLNKRYKILRKFKFIKILGLEKNSRPFLRSY
ncbi:MULTISPECIES: SepM family pheromone-processing serine protease [Lactobacillus]|uniref:endopeptidase La n=1 Tax=Lactobacillus xujianguonis TaxID=2495899 RepID=A0A437SUR7_9LACO|nr:MULTISPECIES: SepM family pheromone-processing serine protease [Lactobacillus]RVU70654.1 PDZ domain-containing protein [Lactobacillus xujianguonis]